MPLEVHMEPLFSVTPVTNIVHFHLYKLFSKRETACSTSELSAWCPGRDLLLGRVEF